MKKNPTAAMATLVFGLLNVMGCDSQYSSGEVGSRQDPGPLASDSKHPRSDDDVVAVPVKYQFNKQQGPRPARTYGELIGRYSEGQKKVIQEFYAGFTEAVPGGTEYTFSGPFSFNSPEQLQWLVRNGYPTPDEVLAAASMSDEQLRKLSEAGNFKASVFLLDRKSVQAQGEFRRDVVGSEDGRGGAEIQKLQSKVVSSGSPFGGYVLARRAKANDARGQVLAGYALAAALGDSRAIDFMHEYRKKNPNIDPVESVLAYQAALSTLARNPQQSDLRAIARREGFPRF